jgi:uncharacterized delta-60 repeat protein
VVCERALSGEHDLLSINASRKAERKESGMRNLPIRLVIAAGLAATIVLSSAGSVLAAPGDLDSTFNGSGLVLGPVGGIATGVAVQSDGKIVAGGGHFALARYNPDGTLDTSFGSGGSTQPTGGDAHALVLQPDGKIVLAGSVCYPCVFSLARYNADGSLDTTFGSGGRATASFSPSATFNDSGAMAVALQGDGKLVAAGNAGSLFGGNAFGVARFNSDGSLDGSFGSAGLAIANFYYWEQADARAVAIQADEKIVVGGSAAGQFVLARFNPDGTLDATFGSGGLARPAYGYAYTVAVQADGKIVEAGQDLSGNQIQVARVNADGSPDSSFGSGGVATTNFLPTAVYTAALAVQVQKNGKVVTAGTAFGNSTSFALTRFNPDGTIDPGFGSNGGVLTAFPGTIGQGADALALQTDGRIVAAGEANLATGETEFALARYLGEPTVMPVTIDIKPDEYPNAINPGSTGTTSVAILTTKVFNAPSRVDTTSLRFGRTGNESSLAFCSTPQDVNADGLPDVVCHFTTQKAAFQTGDTQGVLTGKTVTGTPIKGTDSVVIVPSK